MLSVFLLLSGCLTYGKYTFRFDFNTGKVEKIYHNICSRKDPQEKEYAIENDWSELKKLAGEKNKKQFDPDVIKPVRTELFQENDGLSGKEIFEVQSPKAFPSKTAIFERLHPDKEKDMAFEFKNIGGEIFLFTKYHRIESANGEIVKTKQNHMVAWPLDQTVFEFTVIRDTKPGESLLPFYLKEKTN
jgi:hypothetical protein